MDYETIAVWSRIISTVLVLGLIYWIFRRYLAPAITSAQQARNAEISSAEGRRDTAKAEIETAKRELDQAKREAATMRENGTHTGERERTRLVADAEEAGKRSLRNAQGELARQRAAARDRLRFELIDRALARARADATLRINAGANLRLVEATVSRLERNPQLEETRG